MRLICLLLFFLSGCASLIYEVVWTRQLMLVLGSTTYAITTVVVCFMGGLALGSFLAGRRSGSVTQPGRVYAVLEVIIGAYALLVPLLMAGAEPLYRSLYPHVSDAPWLLVSLRFVVISMILILPTTCMGATLPVLMTYITRSDALLGRSAGWLYGINTLGATLGCALAGFMLMPALGLSRTNIIAAAINLLIGALGWMLLRDTGSAGERSSVRPAKLKKHSAAPKSPAVELVPGAVTLVLAVAALSGVTSMVYQIAWTRALIMSLGSSTYSFTCILVAFILGLGLGSLAIAHFADRFARPLITLGLLELGIGISAMLIIPIHGRIPIFLKQLVAAYWQDYGTLLRLEFLLVMAVTFVPTFLMGAAFPLMTRIVGQRLHKPGEAIGRVYVINTLGAMIGCVLAGFVLIRGDVLGVRNSIFAAALVNAVAGVWLWMQARPAGQRLRPALAGSAVIACVLGIGLFAGQWSTAVFTSGPFAQPGAAAREALRIVFYEEGVDTTVAVEQLETDAEQLSMTVNGKPDASTNPRDVRTQLLLGHLPALLGPEGKPACVVGLGSGMTLNAVAMHDAYPRLDCVEISSAVIRAAALFAPYTNDVLSPNPRVRMVRADGRNHLLLSREQYGLIISEPSNPWISGVSSLFTQEFFEICRQRLTPDGRLAIWMHTYSMSPDDFRMVVRTLCEVFPFVSIWQLEHTDFCLVAGNQPFRVPAATALARYTVPAVRADLYRAGIRDLAGVLGTFVTGGSALRDWASSAPLHTDDNSRLEFSAPRNLYQRAALQINVELNQLQHSPLQDAVDASSPEVSVQYLEARTESVLESRAAMTLAFRQWRDVQYATALENMLRSYERDLGSPAVYTGLRQFAAMLEADPPRAAELRDQLDRVKHMPEPVIVAARGADLAQIAQILYQRGKRSQRHYLPGALVYLTEAHDLDPDDGLTAASLSMAWFQAGNVAEAQRVVANYLNRHPDNGWGNYAAAVLAVQGGNTDEAIACAKRALRSGTITVNQLASDPKLEPVKQIVSFEQLAQEAAQSQPG